MGKKQIIKKQSHTKHKSMFNELQTHEERNILRSKNNKKIQPHQEPSQSLSIHEEDYHCPLDRICQNVNKLIIKNKISTKNAFDIPIIDLQQLPDFHAIDEKDYAWKKISTTLENDYKIFAYRVDAAHIETFKILSSMSMHEEKNQQPHPIQKEQKQQENQIIDRKDFKVDPNAQKKHLEKNISHLNIQAIEYTCDFNPVLQRNKRKFDQSGIKGLLLNNININHNLQLIIISDQKNNIIKQKQTIIQQLPPFYHNLQHHKDIQFIKKITQLKSYIRQQNPQIEQWNNLTEVWNKIEKGSYQQRSEIIKIQTKPYDKMVDESHQQKSQLKNSFVKINNKPRKLLNQLDVKADEQLWMNNEIKKMLNSHQKINNERVENYEDWIDFDLEQQQKRDQILFKQSDKIEHNQQIQDKFLLPAKNNYQFQLNKPLTLRYEEPIQVGKVSITEKKNDQRDLIDLRRQQITIRQIKEHLKGFLVNKQATFDELYINQQKYDKQTSPALCFLTLLHLANENNLVLYQSSQDNFMIRK